MADNEKYQVHPLVQAKWQEGKIILSRMDMSWEMPLVAADGITVLHQFASPAVPAEVAQRLGGNQLVVDFIESLKEYKILVTPDEAAGKILPFDIQAVDDGTFDRINAACKPYTMSDVYLNFALYQAVRYIVSAGIEGDMVECGVWKGGSTMLVILTLMEMGITDRQIYLYDSFNYTWPGYSEHDAQIYNRTNEQTAAFVEKVRQRDEQAQEGKQEPLLSLDEVCTNVLSTGYPEENIHFVKGFVEDTIPATISEKIALLRLDTDFYDSTIHEFKHLYPVLSKGGVLLIDDYPTEVGAMVATDEYLAESGEDILLNRISIQGRIGVRS